MLLADFIALALSGFFPQVDLAAHDTAQSVCISNNVLLPKQYCGILLPTIDHDVDRAE